MIDFRIQHRISAISALLVCGLLVGCGGGEYTIAYVEGTAYCNGKPMTAGIVIFSPIPKVAGKVSENPGKAGTARIGKDGKFVLSTFGDEDGAVVGKHTVRVSMPSNDDDDEGPERPPCGGTVFEPGTTTPKIFDVVGGEDNEFTLEFQNPRVTTGPWAAP